MVSTQQLFARPRAINVRRRRLCLMLVWPAVACAQTPDAQALALQWRLLRTQRGHFDGARWNDEVDRYQGRKHQVMQALAQSAREQSAREATLVQWMGPPDEQWSSGQIAQAQAIERAKWNGAPQGDVLVYNWRARHDRLVFAVHQGRVVATGWLHDFE
jgi:hypothetical protein